MTFEDVEKSKAWEYFVDGEICDGRSFKLGAVWSYGETKKLQESIATECRRMNMRIDVVEHLLNAIKEGKYINLQGVK